MRATSGSHGAAGFHAHDFCCPCPDERQVRRESVLGRPGHPAGPEVGNTGLTAGQDAATTYEGQLAQRAAELLPDLAIPKRLELLGAMDPDGLRTSLAFIASMYPQVFDFALVCDRAMVERLQDRLDEDQDDDEEPYCDTCGAAVGIFYAHGEGWQHYTGESTAASPVELFDAGHEPVIAWRLAGAR